MLYECRAEICYHSLNGPTDWHGDFRTDNDKLVLWFQYEGDEDRLKSVTLFPRGMNRWTGFDYLTRRITLELVDTMVWCDTCKVWC